MEQTSAIVDVGTASLHVRSAGKGYPLILLHGWPETSYCWRFMIPLLAPHFRVIAPDLRGFADSQKFSSQEDYDKRTVANDILRLAQKLGFEQFLLAGHDIGGRVAYRLTLDHPEVVTGLISLSGRYSPLGEDSLFSKEQASQRWYYHFHNIDDGLPEDLVTGREEIYLRHFYRRWSWSSSWLSEEDLKEYVRAYSTPGALKGGFDHYRAALNVDPEQWKADVGRTIPTPTLVLWGADDPVSLLSLSSRFGEVFINLSKSVYAECGHFIAEEKPTEAAHDILAFAVKLGIIKNSNEDIGFSS